MSSNPTVTTDPSEAAPTSRQRNYTLLLLLLVYTSSHVDRQIVAILAQPLKDAFSISDTQIGLLTGFAFALFYATLGMPIAIWADRGNRRNIIALSIALWSAMTALCGAALQFWHLLVARVGVGIGEAGSTPPSHSMLADLYPPEKRGTAMAILATGVNIGIMLGYLIGGWVNEWLDWRWAFVVAGLPGIGLAVLVRFTIREPARQTSIQKEPQPPFLEVARIMWRSGIVRHSVIGGTLLSFAGYAAVAWVPSYFVRVHGFSSGQAGTILALLIGLGGGVGTFLGGYLADRLAPRSEGWRAWVVCFGFALYVPFAVISYTTPSATVAAWAFAPPAIFGGIYIGTLFAIIQSQVTSRMRAVTAAINLFIVNIIGLGLGPTTVGAISDLTQPTLGVDSLRAGLLAMLAIVVWGSFHMYYVGRLLHRQPSTAPAAT